MFFAIIYLILVTVLILIAMFEPDKKHYIPCKMLCSALFVIIELLHSLSLAIIGFCFCFAGDLFMGLYNRYRKKKYIGLGMLLFLLAHVVFLIYLFALYPDLSYMQAVLPLLLCLLGLVLINSFHLHLGRLRYAVLVYSVFVSAFMVKAVSIMLTSGSLRIGYAGIFFWLSDFSLLFYYFYHFRNKSMEKAVQGFNLGTYYVAMLLLALG